MSWDDVCHFIAQGAVNIAEGHTVIEKDSRVYNAMNAFCEYVTKGCVKFDALGVTDHTEHLTFVYELLVHALRAPPPKNADDMEERWQRVADACNKLGDMLGRNNG